jgi:hypothetical protein
MVIAFRLFYHKTIPGPVGSLLVEIGKASYHIFLVQMVYYHFELGWVLFDLPLVAQIPFHIVICVSVGIAFYEIQNHWRDITKRKIKQYML